MKLLRSNIRHGSRVALFALAVQFALSFGHFHGLTEQAAASIGSSIQQQQPASDHDSNQHPNDGCAICAAMAMANTTFLVTPPALLLPQASQFSYLISDAEFVHINSARVAFQPRAPPIS